MKPTLARTLIHEYAHALLHFVDDTERSKREVEQKPSRTSSAGTSGLLRAAWRSISRRGSQTILRSFAIGLTGSVTRQNRS